jgi:hypothetical protein
MKYDTSFALDLSFLLFAAIRRYRSFAGNIWPLMRACLLQSKRVLNVSSPQVTTSRFPSSSAANPLIEIKSNPVKRAASRADCYLLARTRSPLGEDRAAGLAVVCCNTKFLTTYSALGSFVAYSKRCGSRAESIWHVVALEPGPGLGDHHPAEVRVHHAHCHQPFTCPGSSLAGISKSSAAPLKPCG